MAVSPGVKNSTRTRAGDMESTASTEDELSPTTKVLNALKAKGLKPSADNIRRFIEGNARDVGESAPEMVPGLRNSRPEDSGPSVGQRGSSAADVRNPKGTGAPSGSANPPAVNLGGNPYGGEGVGTDPTAATPGTGSPTTSASPDVGVMSNTGKLILAGSIPAAMAGARMLSDAATAHLPEIGPPPRPADVNLSPTAVKGQPGAADMIDYTMLAPDANVNPMEAALQKATAPPAQTVPGSSVPPMDLNMPAVSDDALGNYKPGPSSPVETQKPQVVPFKQSRVGAPPPIDVTNPSAADFGRLIRGFRK